MKIIFISKKIVIASVVFITNLNYAQNNSETSVQEKVVAYQETISKTSISNKEKYLIPFSKVENTPILVANRSNKYLASHLDDKVKIAFVIGQGRINNEYKQNLYSQNTSDFTTTVTLPILRGKHINLALNVKAQYGFSNSNFQFETPDSFEINNFSVSSVGLTEESTGIEKVNFSTGPEIQFKIHNKLLVSTGINIGYLSFTQNAIVAVQKNVDADNNISEYTLFEQPRTNLKGFSIEPNLNVMYMFSRQIGVVLNTGYSIGPKGKTVTSTLIPNGKPQKGIYDLKQLESATYAASTIDLDALKAINIGVGLVFVLNPNPEPAKANIHTSRSNIKQQISTGTPTDSIGNPEPAKANIHTSRSNIKQQISTGTPTDSIGNPEPAKVNIHTSRSNIKQQISTGTPTDSIGNSEPAKENIHTSRSNIKQQISTGTPTDSIGNPEPAKANIHTSRSNIKQQISTGTPTDSIGNPEPAKANIHTSRSNIKQQISTGTPTDSIGNPEPAKANIHTSRSNIKQQISTGTPTDSIGNPEPAKANIHTSRSNIKQ
ncbi:hypothetical protein [Flavobacterium ovatum]|uniref:hypothetical protein n=1 Tax=Flavobacterium ovatum TaxID=1928857 RepID=UPI00344D7DE2